MGIAENFGGAYAKAQLAAGCRLPQSGTVFLSVNDKDKETLLPIARDMHALGFTLVATSGTQRFLSERGIPIDPVFKAGEGRPNVIDLLKSGKIDLIVNTPLGRKSFYDDREIRRVAMHYRIGCITTLSGAAAAANAIHALQNEKLTVCSLQEYHAGAF